MTRNVTIALTALAVALTLGPAVAGDAKAGKTKTLEGKILCAKCSLHVKDQQACQNVLVVEKKGKSKHYYLAQNEANNAFGEVCRGTPVVRVTGRVTKQEGRLWIAAQKIERLPQKG